MDTFRFHCNTEYARKLRDAVNDRQKQSIDNVHEEKKQINGQYNAWNRTCAAMDRLEGTLLYLNQIELGKDRDRRYAFDFYDFINNAYIVIECIKTIGRIFRIDNSLIKEIECSSSVFGNRHGEKGSDQSYFEYIRSLCSVHPLCTNRQKDFLNGDKFHCCPFVVWKDGFSLFMGEDGDLTAIVYTSNPQAGMVHLNLSVSEFEEYLTKWIDLIPKIIEAKNNYTDKEYERLRNEPVNSLADYSNDVVQYLAYLKEEYCKRFDSGGEYLFDDCIRIFTVEVSDRRNIELLAKYQHAILYSLQFLRNELQNMSFEGYENNGILYPEVNYETTLFDLLCSISMFNSSFSEYGYNFGKLYYLEEDWDDYADKRYARLLLEEAKESINRFVHFTNKESDEETIVLVNLALYLESLTRKSLLNKNVPNELDYRLNTLTKSQFEELLVEDEPNESQVAAIEELLRQIEEIGG